MQFDESLAAQSPHESLAVDAPVVEESKLRSAFVYIIALIVFQQKRSMMTRTYEFIGKYEARKG